VTTSPHPYHFAGTDADVAAVTTARTLAMDARERRDLDSFGRQR
jgi:hypothetical protein